MFEDNQAFNRPVSTLARQNPSIGDPVFVDTLSQISAGSNAASANGPSPVSFGPKNSGLATNPTGAAAIETTGAKSGFVSTYLPQIIVGVIVAVAATYAARKV